MQLQETMPEDERIKFLQDRKLRFKFGNAKKMTPKEGYFHYVQNNIKDHSKAMKIEIEPGVFAICEKKKTSYKVLRQKRKTSNDG